MAIVGPPRRATKLAALAATIAGIGILGVCATAYAAPSFDYEPRPVLTGLEIRFESHEASGEIQWDFNGDGAIEATGENPSFTYMRPGTYQATMLTDGDAPVTQDVLVGQLLAPFITFPATPLAGQDVLLVYGGQANQTVPIERYDWELDGDNDFNDASGIVLHRTFPLPGDYVVGLKVTDKDGAFGSEFREIHVRSAATVTSMSLRMLSPFPIIRITGRVTSKGALVRRLTALAPLGAKVTVRCRGRGCPFKSASRVAKRPKNSSAKTTTATVRFRRMERRLLRGGATVTVSVTRQGWIGKYTRWKIRKSKPPQRRDRCLIPGTSGPVACPGS
jgi:hypothetical protein